MSADSTASVRPGPRPTVDEPWYLDSSLPAAAPTVIPEVEPDDALTHRPDEALTDLPEPLSDEGSESGLPAPSLSRVSGAPAPAPDAERAPRSRTIARKQMLRERRRMLAEGSLPEILEYDRPGTRAACRSGARPCLYVACRYHLYLDVHPETGSIKFNFPDREIWELKETCALDVAERGGVTLEEVGDIMNLTRERIRQLEATGLEKMRQDEGGLPTFRDGSSS